MFLIPVNHRAFDNLFYLLQAPGMDVLQEHDAGKLSIHNTNIGIIKKIIPKRRKVENKVSIITVIY